MCFYATEMGNQCQQQWNIQTLFASNVIHQEVYNFTIEMFLPKRFNLHPIQPLAATLSV